MISKIRGIIVVICFILFGIGTLVMGYIIFPLIKLLNRNKQKKLNTYSNFVQYAWKIFVKFLIAIHMIDVQTSDIENLKNIKNTVIVSTHPSFIDGIILISLIPKTTCIVAERLSKNFVFQNIVKSMFILSNGDIEQILSSTNEFFDEGFNVLVFPSGKRHPATEFPKIRRGAALMALHTGKNIVPIKMTTNIPFLQMNEPISKAVDKKVIYNIQVREPILINEYTSKTKDTVILKRDITAAIRENLYN